MRDQLDAATIGVDLNVDNNVMILMETTARCFIGTQEETGKNDGEVIVYLQLTVDGKAAGEPYCMALVQTVIAYVEYRFGIISLCVATESCVEFWEGCPDHLKFSEPFIGAIAVWQHEGTRRGHAGIVFKVSETHVYLVEGNTNPGSHSFNAGYEGQGIYFKKRPHGDVGTMKLLGYVLAFS